MSLSTNSSRAAPSRSGFGSRIGFVLAAAGSAVGLGNIWSFPSQVAENGGAAFVLIYLILSLGLAYPALIAELVIGRYGQRDPVTALESLSEKPTTKRLAGLTGLVAMIFVCLIFCFYSIVSGWLLGFTLSPLFEIVGMTGISHWLTSMSSTSSLVLTGAFMLLTLLIVNAGITKGIERWSMRLMPMLVLLISGLIVSMASLDGAIEGIQHYLLPDFSRLNGPLVMNALGQSFFSMSLGVGVMIVYGSYLRRDTNIPTTALYVCLMDTGVAFLAGLLVVPALFVANHLGISIFMPDGGLVNSDRLVFQVLPPLFDLLGSSGLLIALAFFSLMTIAALTSSISMLEAPVACLTEKVGTSRRKATLLICLPVFILAIVVIFNFELLFSKIILITTHYAQPVNSLLFCLFAGWLLNRDRKLQEIQQGWPDVEHSLFWKIWPWYIRIVCPLFIISVILYSF